MKVAKIVLITCIVVMIVGIGMAMSTGDFLTEGAILTELAWGRLTLLDLYVGFLLFGSCIVYREEHRWVSIPWVLSLLLLGNLAAGIYALQALVRARGSWAVFWMGSGARNG